MYIEELELWLFWKSILSRQFIARCSYIDTKIDSRLKLI